MTEAKLQLSRTLLRDLLEDRFGALPEALTQQIEATTDLKQLCAAARGMSHLGQTRRLPIVMRERPWCLPCWRRGNEC